ncbi:glycosyltransferase family 2 protein [Shewanella saliphila]|uniref:Glycosyltransferase family 2 protein n=1 Tax=Shewanella saliphila TaxID=2282698 RepID=A0ABQ2Q6C3_9GAMM|nr:glycosyltransferase family 2 protein [Shewanella saliphila]MCL1101339.1 glycosyltransferase family 2 protein [Shewanella saliphila]GGP50229.1 hypothetical protein GCM10009409_15890 [Shewanella saliphila]
MTSNSISPKVKLVAIAKDEAAYLPEWIFHHLHFGFDAIDIYVNNTTDNTDELSNALSEIDSVTFIDGNDFFLSNAKTPQKKVYEHAFSLAKKSNFSHIMFLDIDEFWTPMDMVSSVSHCLSLIKSDVISFEWLNKIEDVPFSPAIESVIVGEHHRLVKSITNLSININNLDIHNVSADGVLSVLADGTEAKFSKDNQQLESIGEIKPYLVIHRMYRSRLEYISLLGRGRPKGGGTFKDNRNGFCYLEYEKKTIHLPQGNVDDYEQKRIEFFDHFISDDYMIKAHSFIELRYRNVLELIKNAEFNDFNVLKKILRNVGLSDVNLVYSDYLLSVSNYLSGQVTNALRDGAIALENVDMEKSLSLMEVANTLRPRGPIIIKKIKQYKARLNHEGKNG